MISGIRRRTMSVITVTIFLSAALAAAQYENSTLQAGKVHVRSILIVPPKVIMEKSGLESTDPMLEASHEIEDPLAASVAEKLKQRGYTIVADPFTPNALDADPDLKYTLADVQKAFDSLNTLMWKKPQDVGNDRFTMGYGVNKINPGGAADALIFIRGDGLSETGRRETAEVLFGYGPTYVFHVQIGVVDAHTGSVLYYGKGWSYHPSTSAIAVKWALAQFPAYTNH
jgi:hypothetical protein